MSQATATRAPIARRLPTRGVAASPRPAAKSAHSAQPNRLRVVQPTTAPATMSVGFAASCIALLVGGLLALLMLNTEIGQQSFRLDKLQTKSAALADTQQTLATSLDNLTAPQQLATKAQELGMAPATSVRYVDANGKQVGVAKREGKAPAFTVGTLPSTPASRAAAAAVSAASAAIVPVATPTLAPAAQAATAPAASAKASTAPSSGSPAQSTTKSAPKATAKTAPKTAKTAAKTHN